MRTKSIILGIFATFILATGLISAAAAPPAGTHGAKVSAIAKVKTNVAAHLNGAKKVNHGGAVSAAAKVKP